MSFKKEELLEGIKTLILPELSKLQSTVENLDTRLGNVEVRLDQIDKRFDQVDDRFSQVEKRFDQVDKRFDQVDKRFDQTDKRIDDLRIDTMERFSQVNKQFVLVNKRIDDVGDEMRSRFNHLDQSVQNLGAAVAEVRQYVWTSGVYGRTESVQQPMFVSEESSPYSTNPTLAGQKPNSADKKDFLQNDSNSSLEK